MWWLVAFACKPDPVPVDTAVDTGEQATMSTELLAQESDKYGRVDLDVDIGDDVNALLITATGSEGLVFVEEVRDPAGNSVMSSDDWLYADEHLTMGVYPLYNQVVFNWPVRAEDGPLVAGTWLVTLGILDERGGWLRQSEVAVAVQRKRDPELDEGAVRVRIVYAEGVVDDPDVVGGVEAAVEGWRAIWQDVGLELIERYDTVDIAPILDDPSPDNEAVLAADGGSDPREVTVVIGTRIADSRWTYGVAGGIPGPLIESGRGAVVLGWLSFAGPDGELDEDDVGVFADTLAHEVGHFQGLFHAVEGTWDQWDALEDTTACESQGRCERALGPNLMYPYSLCDVDGCADQHEVSDDQWGVVQRYVGTR